MQYYNQPYIYAMQIKSNYNASLIRLAEGRNTNRIEH